MAQMKGYSSPAAVAALLGLTLTPAQEVVTAGLLATAEETVDFATGRAWLTGAVADEVYSPTGRHLYLVQRPLTSVESVKRRWEWDTTSHTLTPTTDYTADLPRGIIWFRDACTWGPDAQYLVSYTPGATVPASIAQATARLAGDAIGPLLSGVGSDVARLTVWHQIDVTYRSQTPSERVGGITAEVQALLAPFRKPVLA